MADTRTLKLSLLADVNKFTAGMNEADTSAKGLNGKIGKYSKAMAGAFLAVGAAAATMAIKIGVDSVKAAIEDEKSQRILQIQLEKTIGKQKGLTESVEKYIGATQKRVGVQDDLLRPAFARLLRSTQKVTDAQNLLNLALDISVATGKGLPQVADALGKVVDGNATALGRLGLGIDKTILKSGDLDLITKTLRETFGGFADKEAASLDGQLRILLVAVDELKEGIGKNLLPVFKDVVTSAIKISNAFSGEDPDGLSARARELKGEMGDTGEGSLGRSLAIIAESFGNLFRALTSSEADESKSTLESLADAMNSVAAGINAVANAYKFAKSVGGKFLETIIMGEGKAGWLSWVPGLPFGAPGTGPNGRRASGGPVTRSNSYLVGERGPEIFTPTIGGKITSNANMGSGTTIILQGIVDAESARRSIEQLIQRSARRTGAIDWVGATI